MKEKIILYYFKNFLKKNNAYQKFISKANIMHLNVNEYLNKYHQDIIYMFIYKYIDKGLEISGADFDYWKILARNWYNEYFYINNIIKSYYFAIIINCNKHSKRIFCSYFKKRKLTFNSIFDIITNIEDMRGLAKMLKLFDDYYKIYVIENF